jgi:endogenous inhibitor of DNA gyrase (YacG/DUF329 family)
MTERRNDCAVCGEWLEGRQTRFCSARCRQRDYRATHPADIPLKACDLCGTGFRPIRGKQRVCAVPEQADATCRELQEARERITREHADELDEQRWDATCAREGCDNSAGWEGAGRPRRFCSDAHKTAHYRVERRQAVA